MEDKYLETPKEFKARMHERRIKEAKKKAQLIKNNIKEENKDGLVR